MSITATLSPPSPAHGNCGSLSGDFTITLSGPSLLVNRFSISLGGDYDGELSTTGVSIGPGETTGTFKIRPLTPGDRTASISRLSGDASITAGSATYNSVQITSPCPSNSGANTQTTVISFPSPGGFSWTYSLGYFSQTQAQKNLYRGNMYVLITQ